MKTVRIIAPWTVVAVLCFGIGFYCLSPFIEYDWWVSVAKVSSVILAAAATTVGLLLKQSEASPPSELSVDRQARMESKLLRRFQSLWVRWYMILVLALLAAIAGFWPEKHKLPDRIFAGIAFSTISCALTLITLSVHEYRYITREMKRLVSEMKDRIRRQELLLQLRRHEE